MNRNKSGHNLAETLVATIDQISWDILVSYGHEIGYDMHQCVSLPILNTFGKTFVFIVLAQFNKHKTFLTNKINQTQTSCQKE